MATEAPKRVAETTAPADAAAPEKKKNKSSDDGLPSSGDNWTCLHCGNMNWPLRTKCNKKTCNMPKDTPPSSDIPEGSWACASCNNVNWPKRSHCNKKNCNQPRHGSGNASLDSASPYAAGAYGGAGAYRAAGAYGAALGGYGAAVGGNGAAGIITGPDGRSYPEGSWQCTICTNVNYPSRTVCNSKNCGAPKPADAYGGISADPYGSILGGQPNQFALLAAVQQQTMYGAGGYGSPQGALNFNGGGTGNPPGSWHCPKCNNLNWSMRTSCNRKGCDEPKPAELPFMMQAAPTMRVPDTPDGSWVCPTCANVNWPQRTHCNKSNCSTPRPDDLPSGGSLAPYQAAISTPNSHSQRDPPEGSWTCPTCANINWPQRTHCNKSGCTTPRPSA